MKAQNNKGTKTQSLESLLKELGFETVDELGGGNLCAKGVQDFGKAHAAAIDTLGKRAACRRLCLATGPALHVAPKPEAGNSKPKIPNSEPGAE